MKSIHLITAGAGTGKTTKLTDIVQEAMTKGTCRPGGLIATTFTVKAAHEITERIRTRLFQAGLQLQGERLGECLVGTVHSICGRLLERFAFETGISPQVEILSETEANLLFNRALEAACIGSEIERVQHLADQLEDKEIYEYRWRQTVDDLIEQMRANDIPVEELPKMAESSLQQLFGFLPPPDSRDLDRLLADAIDAAVSALRSGGDTTRKTADALDTLEQAQRILKSRYLSWTMWVKLSKLSPAVASRHACDPVIRIASAFEAHSRLRSDIAEYTNLLFDLAGRTLDGYAKLKAERGQMDFTDLEHKTLRLLADNKVCKTLTQELDLLVVDEFQDTSPMQLALFLRLAQCAAQTVWVGDVKQAIYGFRGTDPALIGAVAAELKTDSGMPSFLDISYRSVPDLVSLSNHLFAPAFERTLGLSSSEVNLKSVRSSTGKHALEFFSLRSGQMTQKGNEKELTNAQIFPAIAEGVRQLLGQTSEYEIHDPVAKKLRPVQAGDIAVLCRSNDNAAAMADALTNLGFTVSIGGPGLFATPECRLAMACLRRLADPSDTLSTAIIIAMSSGVQSEELLSERIDYVTAIRAGQRPDRWGLEEPLIDPVIVALEGVRSRLSFFAPSEALDQALIAADVFKSVSCWGPTATRAERRRANLEALRGYVRVYEETCKTAGAVATLSGFVFWHDELAAGKLDCKAADDAADAIHVMTYHKAKGLEWPVTICMDLGDQPKSRIWGLQVVKRDESIPFDIQVPLANRTLRYWVWPFGRHSTGIVLKDRTENSPAGQRAKRQCEAEELRLLYVGLTRARDLIILAHDVARDSAWLDLAGANWLRFGTTKLQLGSGNTITAQNRELFPPSGLQRTQEVLSDLSWFPGAPPREQRLPATLQPSLKAPLPHATIGQLYDLNARLPITGKPEEATLGDALHAIFAAELLNPFHPDREGMAFRVLQQYGLELNVQASDVLACVERFRSQCDLVFPGGVFRVEVPFSVWNSQQQNISGYIDLLIETSAGLVVIDHKSFPGRKGDWAAKALSYSGQLGCYRQALTSADKTVIGTWIHFPVGGGLVEVTVSHEISSSTRVRD